MGSLQTIVLYARRNTGLCALSYLVASGHTVKVISDDENILWMADKLGCEIVTFDTMGEFGLFICVHGNKVLDKKYLVPGRMVNIHPCLGQYPGHNPIKKYIENKNTIGTVESQYLIEEVDAGEVIHTENFITKPCNTFADFYNVALPKYFVVLEATLRKLEA